MQVCNYKTSLWDMEYVARGGAFEHPRIYRTRFVHVASVSFSLWFNYEYVTIICIN